MKDELLLEVFVGKALAEVLSDASDEGLVLLEQGFGGVFVPVLPGECPADVFLILFSSNMCVLFPERALFCISGCIQNSRTSIPFPIAFDGCKRRITA